MTVGSVKVFFYGSFMDREVLRKLGVVPRTFETAKLDHWGITFSPMATLIPSEGDRVYGVLAELSRAEVDTLYSRDDFKRYKPADITVDTDHGNHVRVRCYVSKPRSGQKPSVEVLTAGCYSGRTVGFSRVLFVQA